MGRRKEKKNLKFNFEEDDEDEGNEKRSSSSVTDDDEANEDLSLKIVERALLMRASKLVTEEDDDGDVVLVEHRDKSSEAGVRAIAVHSKTLKEAKIGADPSVANSSKEIATSEVGDLGNKKKVKKKIKKKVKKLEVGENTAVVVKEEKTRAVETTDVVEPKTVETSDNIVFRKLLRGPRYFDPPESSWGTCYNCGEEGHGAAYCTSLKRKKPCFVCGSFDHNAKGCSKAKHCYNCKKGGHRTKDCPEKQKGGSSGVKICLKCGDSGHDMFSCGNEYSADDLKNIQCYICKNFGHLSCIDSINTNPRVVSCYKCGHLGHTGLACARLHGEASGTRPHSSCFKCGEEGHFARECMNSSSKVGKWNPEFSIPTLRTHREEKNLLGSKSAPHDFAKVCREKKPKYEELDNTTPRKPNYGGSRTECPGYSYNGNSNRNNWTSPVTPLSKHHMIYSPNSGDYTSSPHSENMHWIQSGPSMPQGPGWAIQNRFAASRFGNYSNGGMQGNYNQW